MLYHSKNYRENTCYIIAKITERIYVTFLYHSKNYRENICSIVAKITVRIHVIS